MQLKCKGGREANQLKQPTNIIAVMQRGSLRILSTYILCIQFAFCQVACRLKCKGGREPNQLKLPTNIIALLQPANLHMNLRKPSRKTNQKMDIIEDRV